MKNLSSPKIHSRRLLSCPPVQQHRHARATTSRARRIPLRPRHAPSIPLSVTDDAVVVAGQIPFKPWVSVDDGVDPVAGPRPVATPFSLCLPSSMTTGGPWHTATGQGTGWICGGVGSVGRRPLPPRWACSALRSRFRPMGSLSSRRAAAWDSSSSTLAMASHPRSSCCLPGFRRQDRPRTPLETNENVIAEKVLGHEVEGEAKWAPNRSTGPHREVPPQLMVRHPWG